jgi:hypothetical protein
MKVSNLTLEFTYNLIEHYRFSILSQFKNFYIKIHDMNHLQKENHFNLFFDIAKLVKTIL